MIACFRLRLSSTARHKFVFVFFLLVLGSFLFISTQLTSNEKRTAKNLPFSTPVTAGPEAEQSEYYVYNFDAEDLKVDFDNMPNPQITIKVLGYNRFSSLKRALSSLKDSYYDGDKVDIDIFLDHIKFDASDDDEDKLDVPFYGNYQPDADAENIYASSMTDEEKAKLSQYLNGDQLALRNLSSYALLYKKKQIKLSNVHAALYYLSKQFNWPYGNKRIHYRQANVGLQNQWIEQWWPASPDEFAYIVEDDVVVSPWWYRYIKRAVQVYYYNDTARDDSVFGISTQKQLLSVAKDERGFPNHVNVFNHHKPFLFGTIGTWGQLLFPRHWIEFRLWLDTVKSDPKYAPTMEGVGKSILRTVEWYAKAGNNIWTPWFVKFLEKKKYYGIYVNFPSKKYLSVSFQEAGVSYSKTEGPNAILVQKPSEISWSFPPATQLQTFDSCFSRIVTGRMFTFTEDETILQSYEFQKFLWDFSYVFRTVIFVYGADDPAELPLYLNWICGVEASSVNRYIFVTGNKEVADKLLRRKIAVVFVPDIDQYPISKDFAEQMDTVDYNDSISALMLGTSEEFGRYRIPPEQDETFTSHLKNFDYYIRYHHRSVFETGEKRINDKKDNEVKISKAIDILIAHCLQYGFNVATSSVHSIIRSSPFNKIFMQEKSVERNNDVFFPSRFNNIYDPSDMKSKNVTSFDYRQFTFIKCTKRTQKLFLLWIKSFSNMKNEYSSLINLIAETSVEHNSNSLRSVILQDDLHDKLSKAVSELRVKVIENNFFATISSTYEGKKTDPNLDKGASIYLADVSCCTYEDRVKRNIRPAQRLWTSIGDYFSILHKAGLSEIDQGDMMCRRKACFSIYYQWEMEKMVREFDARQS